MLTPGRASAWKIWTIGKISFKVPIFNAVNKANYKNFSLFHRSVSDKSQSWDGKIFFDQRDFILNVNRTWRKKRRWRISTLYNKSGFVLHQHFTFINFFLLNVRFSEIHVIQYIKNVSSSILTQKILNRRYYNSKSSLLTNMLVTKLLVKTRSELEILIYDFQSRCGWIYEI